MKSGKTVISGKVVVAADGESRTVTAEGTDASGKPIGSAVVSTSSRPAPGPPSG
jgi:hypothetical protein